MDRYPLLERMRAERQRREDEIAAPYREAAARDQSVARQESEARRGLERIVASKIAEHVVGELSHKMSRALEMEILKQVSGALKTAPTTTIDVPTAMLMYADQRSIVSRVVEWWKRETAPRMDVRAYRGEEEMWLCSTAIEVRLPELRCRQLVNDSAL